MNRKHLILVGGGHSHLFVLRAFTRNPLPNVRITLVSPDVKTPYSGALSAWMCAQADESAIYIDLKKLADQAGAQLVTASVVSINTSQQTLQLSNDETLSWDCLSLNTGSTPDLSHIAGASEYAFPVKPISGFMSQWKALLKQVAEQPEKPLNVAFIGAGVAGSELALTAGNFLNTLPASIKVHLFSDSPSPAPGLPERFQQILSAALDKAGVEFHANTPVSQVNAEGVTTAGTLQTADYCFITTGAAAPSWATSSGLTCDPGGFILVRDTLQSVSHSAVFAAGDIASLYSNPIPKSGVYAVRMGPLLASNLKYHLQNKPLKSYQPQQQALAILHTGQKTSLATRGNWASQGYVWWLLKHWLDRRFIRLFTR